MSMFFDLETSGLPERVKHTYYHPSIYSKYDCSRIIELAYIIEYKDNPNLIRKSFFVKPDNFKVENSHIHGITESMLLEGGLPIGEVLDELNKDMVSVVNIIAHNIKFDYNVLLSECYRYQKNEVIESLISKNRECTMNMGKLKFGLKKYPKLVELYEKLYNDKIYQNHRALDDAELCKKCYTKM